jgi:Pvc16 N-terminal domain
MEPGAIELYQKGSNRARQVYHRENADLVEVTSHSLLGRAMSTLYDHPVLGRDDIRHTLPDNDLYLQPERVRITLQPLSLEDLSKIWTMFRTRYRISVSYEVSVVLIESKQTVKAPLPVLRRGRDDSGIVVQPDVLPSTPTLLAIELAQQPDALPGDTLTLRGHHLMPDTTELTSLKTMVRFTNTRWQEPIDLLPEAGATTDHLRVTLPNTMVDIAVIWPAGFYTVSVAFVDEQNTVVSVTNERSFSLAPQILSSPPMSAVRDTVSQAVRITLQCNPAIVADQRVSLLLRDREIRADVITPPQNQLTFQAGNIAAGDYPVRLRVDGIDSPLVRWQNGDTPTFDPTQKVTVPT